MKFFVDIVDIDEIWDFFVIGMVDGVIMNLFFVVKVGCDFFEVLDEICEVVFGFVSVEVIVIDVEIMIVEGCKFSVWVDNIVVKVLLIWDGLKVCKVLIDDDIMVNVMFCFLVN